jgi:hypothetical protein
MKSITDVANTTKEFHKELVEARRRRDSHWARLRLAKEEYQWHVGFTFTHWLEQTYGIRLILDQEENITEDYHIVDPAKYSFYLLKFS